MRYISDKINIMELTSSHLNRLMFFKIPCAFWCGLRVKQLSPDECTIKVRHSWFNQNPFKSMHFAVQAMAAEFSTGALVMYHIKKSGKSISMLVISGKLTFTKKARGKISFVCNDGHLIGGVLQNAITTGEGQAFTMVSTGTDEKGDVVSVMEFEWTVKVKKS